MDLFLEFILRLRLLACLQRPNVDWIMVYSNELSRARRDVLGKAKALRPLVLADEVPPQVEESHLVSTKERDAKVLPNAARMVALQVVPLLIRCDAAAVLVKHPVKLLGLLLPRTGCR